MKDADGTTTVMKGDTITTLKPDGMVTERNTATRETTTYSVKDPGPEGENITRQEIAEWMEQKAGYDWLLQNATGRGPGGGEEINPTREGGTEYGTSTGAFAGTQDQQHSLVGQPAEPQYGGGGDKSGSTDHDRGGAIDPTDEVVSPGEMGPYQDDPLGAPPSDASSLLDGGDADDEGGFGFTYDPVARREAIDGWSAWAPQTPPEEQEDDASDTVDDFGGI